MQTQNLARPVRPVVATQFEVALSLDGYLVIDSTSGREMTTERPYQAAMQVAADLNLAAANGPKAIARALGAVEDEEFAEEYLIA